MGDWFFSKQTRGGVRRQRSHSLKRNGMLRKSEPLRWFEPSSRLVDYLIKLLPKNMKKGRSSLNYYYY